MFKALVRVSHEGLRKKHNNFNKRARIRILQSYFSAKFFDSLAHASDADAEAIRTKLSNLRSNPLPSSRTVMANWLSRWATRKTVVSKSDESRGKSRGCRSSELSMPLRFVINKSDYGVQCIARTRCRALCLTTVRGEPWRSWVSVSELTFGPSRPLFVQPIPMFRAGLTEPALLL